MLANMASSLIMHKRITTTVAKAKALRVYVEPIITKSKEDTTHSRRTVFSYLQDKNAVSELFREIGVKVADRPGGYTRILKTGNRLGDNAEMCIIELVDYNENMLEATKKKSKTRRRRGGGSAKPQAEAIEGAVEVADEPVADAEVVQETKVDSEAQETEAAEAKEEAVIEEKAEESVQEEVKEEPEAEEKTDTTAEAKEEEKKDE